MHSIASRVRTSTGVLVTVHLRLTVPELDGTVLPIFSSVGKIKKGAGHHEIGFRVDCHTLNGDYDSGAAGHQVESAESSKLSVWTQLVSNGLQAISTRSDQATSHGEFAAAA